MSKQEKVVADLNRALQLAWDTKEQHCNIMDDDDALTVRYAIHDALELLKEQAEEIKALRQLVEWAVECDFGYDNLYYKEYVSDEEIANMGYTEGLIYIAKKAVARDG